MTGTSVIVQVVDNQGNPIAGALVNFIANGFGLSNLGPNRTDAFGRIVFGWTSNPGRYANTPPSQDEYSCHYTITKNGFATARKQATLKRNKQHSVRVVLGSSATKVNGTAEDRWKLRTQKPVDKRSESEILDDLVWASQRTSKVLKGTKVALALAKHVKHHQLDTAVSALGAIEDDAVRYKSLAKVDVINKQLGGLKATSSAVTKLSAAATVVNGLYEVVDAAEAGNFSKAMAAGASMGLRLVFVANPFVAGIDLVLSITLGMDWLTRVVTLAMPGAPTPSQLEGVVLTSLREFSAVGSCPYRVGDKQYRINVSTSPYKTEWSPVPPIRSGLTFDNEDRNQLIYVDADGKHPLMVWTEADAKSLPARFVQLRQTGKLPL